MESSKSNSSNSGEIPITPFNSSETSNTSHTHPTILNLHQHHRHRHRSRSGSRKKHSQRRHSSIRRSDAVPHQLHHHLTDVKENSGHGSESDTSNTSIDSKGQTEFERKNMWYCCGYEHIDKRMITYIVQVLISGIVLCFCMFKLSEKNPDSDLTIWVSLLSGIVGNYLPSAQLK